MLTLKLALRNIFRHKARSVITLSTIMFGCIALIFVGGFFEDIFLKIREGFIRSQTGHIQIYRRGFNEHGKIDPYSYLIDNPDQIKELLKAIPQIKSLTMRLYFSGLISTGENTISFLAQGIEPQNERYHRLAQTQNLREYVKMPDVGLSVISFGEGLEEYDSAQVVLGKGLAETMQAQIGSTVTLLTNTVNGSTNAMDVKVKGIFYTATKDFDDIFLRLPLKTAQKLLNTQSVERLVLQLDKTENTGKVYAALQGLITEKNLDLEIRRWEDLADFYNKTVKMFNQFYLIMRVVTVMIVILGIFNTLNMSVMERISEIGTIMALGIRQGAVMKLFLLEGFLLGIIGGVLGVLVGILVVSVIGHVGIIMPPPPGATMKWISAPFVVEPVVVSTFFMSVCVGGISALYPAYKASRMQITTALRYR
jgi:putative ABC transport system permease protein